MYKKIVLFFLPLFFSSSAIASEEYKKFCTNPKDATTILVCAVSKNLGVSPMKVGGAMVIASIQMTGTYCNFSFTNKFLETRMRLESDQETASVVRHFITMYKDKPPPGFNGDKKVFCKMQYETLNSQSSSKIFK